MPYSDFPLRIKSGTLNLVYWPTRPVSSLPHIPPFFCLSQALFLLPPTSGFTPGEPVNSPHSLDISWRTCYEEVRPSPDQTETSGCRLSACSCFLHSACRNSYYLLKNFWIVSSLRTGLLTVLHIVEVLKYLLGEQIRFQVVLIDVDSFCQSHLQGCDKC